MSIARNDEPFNPAAIWNQYRQENWAVFAAEVFGDMPPKRWEFFVAAHLFERGYHADSIKAVLEYAAAWGTVECCRPLQFDDTDRATVERLLPEVPGHQWMRWDDYYWTMGGEL